MSANKPQNEPVRDARTGKALKLEQPGYYPGFSTMRQKGYWDEATRKLVEERVAKNNPQHPEPLKFFKNEEDAALMRAVVDRILPQEDRIEERRVDILAGIDKRLAQNKIDGYRYEDMPPDTEAYRIAVRGFHAMSKELHGKKFVELTLREREEILKSLHDKKPLAAKKIWDEMSVKRFWEMLVTDCVTVYYGHPWAWDEIGFGGPAYPRGYMRLEEGEPEPWEVGEQRYEWLAPEDSITDIEEESPFSGEGSSHGQGGTH